MKRIGLVSLITTALLLGAGSHVRAEMIEVRVTPEYAQDPDHPIQVHVARTGTALAFVISLSAKDGHLSPFLFPRLSIEGSGARRSLPVTLRRRGDLATFRFWVPTAKIAGAVFECTEQNYGSATDAAGSPKLVPYLGGTLYDLSLADFTAPR